MHYPAALVVVLYLHHLLLPLDGQKVYLGLMQKYHHPIGMKKEMMKNVHLKMIILRIQTIGRFQMVGKKHLPVRKQEARIVSGKVQTENGGDGIRKDVKVEKSAVHIGMIGVDQGIILIPPGKAIGYFI
ncbi:MAG: hypothetical protein AB2794_20670 [Candidatus Thiodiazotropha endolucinida]